MGKEKNRRKIKEIKFFNGETFYQILIYGLVQHDVIKHDVKNDVNVISAYDDVTIIVKYVW